MRNESIYCFKSCYIKYFTLVIKYDNLKEEN